MITTLGFSIRVELAHHRQGQSPILMLVRLFSISFTPSNPVYIINKAFHAVNQTRLILALRQSEEFHMSRWHEIIFSLDQVFPYLLLIYGSVLCVVLEVPFFQKIALENPHPIFQNLAGRRIFAWVCLVFGGLWSLQNLWLYS